MISSVQEILLRFALVILLGVIFRHLNIRGLDKDSVRPTLNALVFNLFLPALCIESLYSSTIDLDTMLVPVVAGLTTITTMTVALVVYAVLGSRIPMTRQEKGALLISATFGNVVYLGLPVLTGLYGDGAAKYALFYDLFAATPLLWFVSASLAARDGEIGRVAMRDSFKTIASLPPVWGILIGIALKSANVVVPQFLLKSLGMLGSLAVPLMIFSIGLSFSLPKVRHASLLIPAIMIKLAVAPFIAFTVAALLGMKGHALASCMVEGAMPTMVLSLLIASRFGFDESLSALAIVITTVISFFTLPIAISMTI
ncbi:MAG: AEC family transporter [Dissulfurispiraceae bacterium]